MSANRTHRATLVPSVIYRILPGPTRKRVPRPYRYRLTYRTRTVNEAGCLLLWEVDGGRLPYQIALERNGRTGLKFHCTCADAIYRGENAPHRCKHVQGLLDLGRGEAAPTIGGG